MGYSENVYFLFKECYGMLQIIHFGTLKTNYCPFSSRTSSKLYIHLRQIMLGTPLYIQLCLYIYLLNAVV
jgi:hypothetical protein